MSIKLNYLSQVGLNVWPFSLYLFLLFLVPCDHMRAPEYYIASVLASCSWKAYSCRNYTAFKRRRCLSCNGSCPSMGYDADRTKKKGKFYLKTNRKAPFCGKPSATSSFSRRKRIFLFLFLFVCLFFFYCVLVLQPITPHSDRLACNFSL